MNRARPIVVLLLPSAVATACVTEFEPDVGDVRAGLCSSTDSDPDQDVLFSEDILPLMLRERREAGCNCHQTESRSGRGTEETGLVLDGYSTLMASAADIPGLLLPGDPCGSLIVQKLSPAPPFGSRMPEDGPPYWTPAERQLLSDWIVEGAHDN